MPLNIRDEIDEAIILELQKEKDLKDIYCNIPDEQKSVIHFEKKIKKTKKEIKTKYDDIKEKIVSRKVSAYIATMTDTYAESMYRNLIGSEADFIL